MSGCAGGPRRRRFQEYSLETQGALQTSPQSTRSTPQHSSVWDPGGSARPAPFPAAPSPLQLRNQKEAAQSRGPEPQGPSSSKHRR